MSQHLEKAHIGHIVCNARPYHTEFFVVKNTNFDVSRMAMEEEPLNIPFVLSIAQTSIIQE